MRIGLTIIGLAIASSGCIFSPTPNIPRDERPTAKDAYLYGHFEMSNSVIPTGGLRDAMGVAFIIGCQDGNEYSILFSRFSFQMIKIAPSICSLRRLIYLVDEKEASQKPIPDMPNVQFDPGKAYYLGDFVIGGEITSEFSWRTWEWEAKAAVDNYDETTQLMRRNFPHFTSFPTEKQLRFLGFEGPDASEVERESQKDDQMQACSDEFGKCRVSCRDRGGDCLEECVKTRDECGNGPQD